MTPEEEKALRRRVEDGPDVQWSSRGGHPVLHKGYGAQFIDHFLFSDPDVYVRNKKVETDVLKQLPRLSSIAQRIDKFLETAYQAHRDARALLAEVDRLRERLADEEAARNYLGAGKGGAAEARFFAIRDERDKLREALRQLEEYDDGT